jgi:Competence-damaged protein
MTMVALLHSGSFFRLVNALKAAGNKKCVVVEQCCGGLITASIMAQPGASRILVGGSVVYDTKSAKPLLLNNDALYDSIRSGPPVSSLPPSPTFTATDGFSSSAEEEENYVASKLHWTAETSVAFCQNLGTDYAIAEGS